MMMMMMMMIMMMICIRVLCIPNKCCAKRLFGMPIFWHGIMVCFMLWHRSLIILACPDLPCPALSSCLTPAPWHETASERRAHGGIPATRSSSQAIDRHGRRRRLQHSSSLLFLPSAFTSLTFPTSTSYPPHTHNLPTSPRILLHTSSKLPHPYAFIILETLKETDYPLRHTSTHTRTRTRTRRHAAVATPVPDRRTQQLQRRRRRARSRT